MGNGLASDGDECDRGLLSSRSEVGVKKHDGPLVLGEDVEVCQTVEGQIGMFSQALARLTFVDCLWVYRYGKYASVTCRSSCKIIYSLYSSPANNPI
jgi:hypothetical protein